MYSYLAVTPRAETLAPSSQTLDFASVCVQSKLALSHVQEAQPRVSRANDMSVFVAAAHPDTSLWRLLVLLNFFSFDSCPRRGGSQGARDSLF